jgi:hypothetical protein
MITGISTALAGPRAAGDLARRARARGELFSFDHTARLFRAQLPAYRADGTLGGRPYPSSQPAPRSEHPPIVMEATTPVKRAVLALKRLFAILTSRLRRAFGSLVTLVLHDQMGDLSRQTERLGSATVESVTYVGGELKALEERLSAMEQELAAIRSLLERSTRDADAPLEAPDEVASGPPSG